MTSGAEPSSPTTKLTDPRRANRSSGKETMEIQSEHGAEKRGADSCAAPCSAFRVRQPLPFGKHELWPSEYPTLGDAIREVDRVGNTAVEIINAAGEVVMHSKRWWKKHGKDGRP